MSKSKISADSYSKQIHWNYKHLRAANYIHPKKLKNPFIEKVVEERMKRFELSTFSLARRCSTTELHPHNIYNILLK